MAVNSVEAIIFSTYSYKLKKDCVRLSIYSFTSHIHFWVYIFISGKIETIFWTNQNAARILLYIFPVILIICEYILDKSKTRKFDLLTWSIAAPMNASYIKMTVYIVCINAINLYAGCFKIKPPPL